MRDVFVSGIGCVTSFGFGVNTLWDALISGRSAATRIPESFRAYHDPISNFWAPLPSFNWKDFGISRAEEKKFDPLVLMAYVAAQEALEKAALRPECVNPKERRFQLPNVDNHKLGISMGTGMGGGSSPFNNYVPHLLKRHKNLLDAAAETNPDIVELKNNLEEHPRVNPFVICQTMPNALAANLAIRYQALGLVDTACFACAASTVAISRAFNAIQMGQIDVAICGGSEYFGDRAGGVFMGFDLLRTLTSGRGQSDEAAKPFDRHRDGFLFSEGGAGILILESREHIESRNHLPIAKLVNTAITNDSTSLVAIDPNNNQIRTMLDQLFQNMEVDRENVKYINSHGTGTIVNDLVEAEVLSSLFEKDAVVNTTKSLLGHSVGACGAIEAITTIKSLSDRVAHPNLNISEPITDFNFPKEPTSITSKSGVSLNMAFGGHNASLLFEAV